MKKLKYILILLGVITFGWIWADQTSLSMEIEEMPPNTGSTGHWRNNPPVVDVPEEEPTEEIIEITNPTLEIIEITLEVGEILDPAYEDEVIIEVPEEVIILQPEETIEIPVTITIPEGFNEIQLPPIQIIPETNDEDVEPEYNFEDIIIYNSAPEDIDTNITSYVSIRSLENQRNELVVTESLMNDGLLPVQIAYEIVVSDWLTSRVLDTHYVQHGKFIIPGEGYDIGEVLGYRRYLLPISVDVYVYQINDDGSRKRVYESSDDLLFIPWEVIIGLLLIGVGLWFFIIARLALWVKYENPKKQKLSDIALQYDVKLSRLARKNDLPTNATIKKDQEVWIPRFRDEQD